MQIGGPSGVGITPRQDAATGRTAGAGRKEGLIESLARPRERIKVRGPDCGMAKGPDVVPRDVIRDDDHEIEAIMRPGVLRG